MFAISLLGSIYRLFSLAHTCSLSHLFLLLQLHLFLPILQSPRREPIPFREHRSLFDLHRRLTDMIAQLTKIKTCLIFHGSNYLSTLISLCSRVGKNSIFFAVILLLYVESTEHVLVSITLFIIIYGREKEEDVSCSYNSFFRGMNQINDKKYSITKAYRWKPQEYLSNTSYGRGKTFFESQIPERETIDPFRNTESRFKKRKIVEVSIAKTPIKESEEKIKRRRASGSVKQRVVRLQRSPYLSNSVEIEKMLRLLVPVHGPNESLKLQIKRHNDMNIRNAEMHIMKKSQTFSDRMKAYSSRMGLPEGSKLFMMNSRDTHIKAALLGRGWVQSGDKDSMLFHLKWVYKDNVTDYSLLQEGQFYNHFRNNQELTNKNELRKNIKKHPAELRPSFPLSFDLELNDDNTSFQHSFIRFEAYRLLDSIGKILSNRYQNQAHKVQTNKLFTQNLNSKRQRDQSRLGAELPLLYRKDIKILKLNRPQWQLLTILFQVICFFTDMIGRDKEIKYSIFQSKRINRDSIRLMKKLEQQVYFRASELLAVLSPFYIVEILKLWKHAKEIVESSYGFQNMWIVKPTGVSRGSGIQITNDMTKLIQLRFGKIVQKYIQFPLLLDCKRKFDIRQWILVKSFSPLRAYAFRKCYGRFSSVKYSNDKYENMQKHLTNYSQNKQSYFRQKLQLKDHLTNNASTMISSSVMSEDELSQKIGGRWASIKQTIFHDVLKTLNCCKSEVTHREGCFEVFGFDIILDQAYKPYILEVNMSPACENRQFLGTYLSDMAEGLVDMLQGGQPTNWIELDFDKFQKRSNFQKNIKKRQASVLFIQKWWRKHVKSRKSSKIVQ